MVTDKFNISLCVVASSSATAARAEADEDFVAEAFGVDEVIIRPLTFQEMMKKYKGKTIFEHVSDVAVPQRVLDFC
jgi:hypothetical protein